MDDVLPYNYRFRLRFLWTPTVIAGRRRWLESVRVIQRYVGAHWSDGDMMTPSRESNWVDVGWWDESFASLVKDSVGLPEL